MSKLQEKVAAFKLIARDSLRMELISKRLSKIAGLEDDLAHLAKSKTETEHDMKVENYEISKLDKDHPNFDKTKATKEETVKFLTTELENLAKQVEETNKLLTEQNEAVAKIESGETKVCLESLNELVTEMIRQSAVIKVE